MWTAPPPRNDAGCLDALVAFGAVVFAAMVGVSLGSGISGAPDNSETQGAWISICLLIAILTTVGLIGWRLQRVKAAGSAGPWWGSGLRVLSFVAAFLLGGFFAGMITSFFPHLPSPVGAAIVATGVLIALGCRHWLHFHSLHLVQFKANAMAPSGGSTPATPAPSAATAPPAGFGWWWNGAAWMPLQTPSAPGALPLPLQAKNPALHLVASFFVPGLGSILAGRTVRGVAVLVSTVVLYAAMFTVIFAAAPFPQCSYVTLNGRTSMTCAPFPSGPPSGWLIALPIIYLTILGVWVFGLVDGYRSAQAWNRAHGIPG